MAISKEHKLDYAIKYLKQERSRISTERNVANSKDYDFARDMEWIVNGLDAAIQLSAAQAVSLQTKPNNEYNKWDEENFEN